VLTRLEPVLAQIEAGELPADSGLTSLFDLSPLVAGSSQLALVRRAAVACASRGLLGSIHADLNLAFAGYESSGETLADADVVDAFAELEEGFASELRSAQLALRGALTPELSEEILPAVGELVGFVERRLPVVARAQAVAHLAAGVLRDRGQGGEAEALGGVAVRAGATTREALASHAAAHRVALNVFATVQEDEVAELAAMASDVPFDADVPNGRDVDLTRLEEVDDGTFVEIRGFVTAHEAERDADGKLISRLDLLDPSSGAQARAAAIFTELAHAGVTRGAFCRVNGIFRVASELCDGGPGVEIDRVSHVELARGSWWAAFLRLSDPWYPHWRNGSNLYWSLGPYRIVIAGEEVDEEASDFGAGELIFRPFFAD
jgi:hypothetical protein